jgi:hypothetical protein
MMVIGVIGVIVVEVFLIMFGCEMIDFMKKLIVQKQWLRVSRRVYRRFKKQDKLRKKNDSDLKRLEQLSDLLDKL